jgi:hypothetical protein
VAKPTISVPPLARRHSTKTLQNMLAARLGIQVTAAVAANAKRLGSTLKQHFSPLVFWLYPFLRLFQLLRV